MKSYLMLLLFFWGMFSIPKESANQWRSGIVALTLPSWQRINQCKMRKADSAASLQMENDILRRQVQQLKQVLLFEKQTQELSEEVNRLRQDDQNPNSISRANHLIDIIEKQMHAIPACVIFREASLWSSGIWLNVGEKNNRALNLKVVAVKSPVLSGGVLVGIVEQVEEHRCRVRLITDAALSPSVCVVRGDPQQRLLAKQIDSLIQQLALHSDLPISNGLTLHLKEAQAQLNFDASSFCLAVGTLQGANRSKYRARATQLRGVGFHSSALIGKTSKESKIQEISSPLIKIGDLLVTTGMDGVFPADLPIATVCAVLPVREGACSYEIEATPLIPDFDELVDLFVIPPNNAIY